MAGRLPECFQWLLEPDPQKLLNLLQAEGGEGRFVGGVVRDSLLGLPPGPTTDRDVATTHPPDRVVALLEAAQLPVIPLGLAHGTVGTRIGPSPYEITTLRRDVTTDGRHAEVAFTCSWEDDARRRDFTLNALYLDRHGVLYDPCGGREDLAQGRVRFIGNPEQRIKEDYLRLLRFFRFSARYGKGTLDPASLAACIALKEGIALLSKERITTEFLRMLADPLSVAPILVVLKNTGILHLILGTHPFDLAAFQSLAELLTAEKAWHARMGPEDRSLLALYALIQKPLDEGHLRLSRRQHLYMDQVHAVTSPLHHLVQALTPVSASTQDPDISCLFRCLLADVPHGPLGAQVVRQVSLRRDLPRKDQVQMALHLLQCLDTLEIPLFPLQGRHLLDMGFPQGPALGHVLAEVRAFWKNAGAHLSLTECQTYARQCGERLPSGGPRAEKNTEAD